MNRLLLVFLIVIVAFYVQGQTTIQTNSVPASLTPCGNLDTVFLIIQSVSGVTDIRLEASMPADFRFISLETSSNVIIVDTSNKQIPYFEVLSIPAGGTQMIKFTVETGCNANTGSISFQLKDNNNINIGSAVTSSIINIEEPNIIFSGQVNTSTSNQSGINLNQLLIGDQYIRTFQIDYTPVSGSIDSLTILVEKQYHIINGISAGNLTYSVTGDTAFYSFNSSDFGGASLSPTNNVFIFSDTLTVSYCSSTSQSVNSNISVQWGCFGSLCQDLSVSATGSVLVSNPTLSYVTYTADIDTFCQVTHSYSFTVENTQTSTGTNADYAYNLAIQLPFVNNYINMMDPTLWNNQLIYDSVTINGQLVPFNQSAYGVYPIIDSLTPADYSSGGLADVDADGFVDDLPSDSTITVKVFYHYNYGMFYCGMGSSSRKIIHYYGRKAIYIDYDNMCGVAQTQFRKQAGYQYLDYRSDSFTGDAIASDGVSFSITFDEWAQFHGFDWENVRIEKRFIVPKGVSFAPNLNITWNGVTNNGSVNYFTVTKSGTTYDTLSVWTDRMRSASNSNDNFTIDLINNCALNLDTCSDLIIYAESYLHIYDSDTTNPCYVSPLGCDSITLIKDCGALLKGYNIISQSFNRATFGWTDYTKTTYVNENSPGVILDKAHPYDSLKLSVEIIVKDTAYSNLYLNFEYSHNSSTIDPLMEIIDAHSIEVTVSSGNTFTYDSTFTYNLLSVTKTNVTSNKENYQLDLSSLLAVIRTDLVNPNYLFGGEVGSNIYTSDTIKIDFYLYSNQLADYDIKGVLISYDDPALISSLPSCTYKGVGLYIDHESESAYSRFVNAPEKCSNTFYFTAGFTYWDAGSTNDPAASIIGNFDPYEYKPYTEFSSVNITWDESVYYLDITKPFYSTRYLWGGINISDPVRTIPIPSNFINIISSNEVTIATASLYKRYGDGVRDHLYVAIPLINSCGRDLSSNSGNQRITYSLYRDLYPQAFGGPVNSDVFNDNALAYSSEILPIQNLTILTPSVDAVVDTLEWDFELRNTHNSELMPFTWLDIQNPSGEITAVEVNDGANVYPLLPYSGGFWVKLDTLLSLETKTLTIRATYTSCGDDSLIINMGYNCAQYPIDPAQGYPQSGYWCSNKILSDVLLLKGKTPLLQNSFTLQSSGSVSLCDTIDYIILGQNSNDGPAKNLHQTFILPASNISIISGSSEIEYPFGSGNWVLIADPILNLGTYDWDLSANFNAGIFPASGTLLDSNKFQLRFKIHSGCPFTSGHQVKARLTGEYLCGQNTQSLDVVSDPIIVSGLPPNPNTTILTEFDTDTLNACADSVSFIIYVNNTVGNSTNGNELIILKISDTNLIAGNIFNIHNGSYLQSSIPTDTIISGIRNYEWEIAAGLTVGDSIKFEINVAANNFNDLSCGKVAVVLSTVERHDIYCPSDSSYCGVNFNIDNTEDSVVIDKGDIEIGNAEAILNGCNDSIELEFKVKNVGALIQTGTNTIVQFALDQNGNNVLDASDPIYTGQEYTILDSLNTGDSLIITHNLGVTNDPCKIFIFIDTPSCVCGMPTLSVDLGIDMQLDTFEVCESGNLPFTICTSSIFAGIRTYQWSDANLSGAEIYLSNINTLNPIFSPPSVTVATTFTYSLKIIRGLCIDYDTLRVTVIPDPDPISLSDTMLCNGIFILTPDTFQPNIEYSIWDALIAGNNLGIAPLNVTINSDTSFYFEIRDLNTNCISSPRDELVIFIDSLPPTATCTDTTIYLDATGNYTIDSSYIDDGSQDNCGISSLSLSQSSFNCSDTGINAVTLYAQDISGNIDSCVSTLTVVDDIAPTAICTDTTIYLDATGNYTIDSSYIDNGSQDNCGISALTLSQSAFDCSHIGINAITLSAHDISGNINICTSNVTVVDDIDPTAICTDTTIYLDATGNYTIDSSYIEDGSLDNCVISALTLSQSTFDCSHIGTNFVTLYAEDTSGNTGSCTSTVTVIDSVSPTATCTDTTIYLDSMGTYTIDSSYIEDGSQDNCGISSFSLSQSTFDCSHIGTNLVTLFVEDTSGNTGNCTSTVTVIDSLSPTATCKDTTVYLDSMGIYTIDSSYIEDGSQDNCGISALILSQSTFDCSHIGANFVTLSAEDTSGNTGSCTSTVTVIDSLSPTATCTDTTVYLDSMGTYTIDSSYIDNGSQDNCGISSFSLSQSTFDCSHIGTNFVTLSSDDTSGNTGSCTSTVTVIDSLSPTATCTDTTVYLDATGNYTIDSSYIDNGSQDNCGISSFSLSQSTFDCSHIGTNLVTLFVEDTSGNTGNCTSTVTVIDSLSPTATCKDTTVYLDSMGIYTIDSSYIDDGSQDNCGISALSLSQYSFDCSHIGITNVVTLYADYIGGNIDSCTSTVTVIDSLSPTAICTDTTIYLDATGNYTIDNSYIDNGSQDNCGISALSLSQSTFDCSHIGINFVTLYAEDISGNIGSCKSDVTVIDSLSTTASCKDATVYLDVTGNFTIDSSYLDNGSHDNCGISGLSLSQYSFDCNNIGINAVALYAHDISGNIDSCLANITVIDNIPPEITCQGNIEVFLETICEFTVPDYTSLSVSNDNCFGSDSLIITQDPPPGSIIDYKQSTDFVNNLMVTLTATDTNLNNSHCTFDVEITCGGNIFIPNVFSPNGDTHNDELLVLGKTFKEFRFRIFNRWGQMIFESNDWTLGWDGTKKGKPVDPGVYVYQLIYTDSQNEDVEITGNVTLIR